VLDELLKDYKDPRDLLGKNGILKELTKRLLERALDGEMTNHLGYEKYNTSGHNSGNSRNGKSKKTLKGEIGELSVEIPRDRVGKFDPKIIKKGQRRFDGFDDRIISMYARGMTTRSIQGHLKDIYGVDISPDLVSDVTDSIISEVKEWQDRPLDSIYPILYLDGLVVKVKEEGHIINKCVYLAIGINMQGTKDLLGIWIEETEGAKFWLKVITELKNRGIKDILIACVDGLKGFPEAIESVFPKTQVQLCILHMTRNSLKYVPFKDRKAVATDLKAIYRAKSREVAEKALDEFEKKWNKKYPTISKSWRTHWEHIIPFFNYPDDIRHAIYTTNAIESLNMSIRKVIKNRGHFPKDDAVLKILYLALKNIMKKWTMPIKEWGKAINQFAIIFDGRVPMD